MMRLHSFDSRFLFCHKNNKNAEDHAIFLSEFDLALKSNPELEPHLKKAQEVNH